MDLVVTQTSLEMPLELVSEEGSHSSTAMTERYYVNPSSERIKCMINHLGFELPKGV